MEYKAWIDVKSPRFSYFYGYKIYWSDAVKCGMCDTSKRIQISAEPVISAITSKYQWPDFSVIPQYDITT